MPALRRRGPYKRHLENVDIPVPRTTAWERRQPQQIIIPVEDPAADIPPVNLVENQLVEDMSGSDIEISVDGSVPSAGDSDSESRDSNGDGEVSSNSVRSSSQSSADSNSSAESEDSANEDDFEDLPQEMNGANMEIQEEGDRVPFVQIEAGRGLHLYDGCRLTAEESSALIMAFIIRWGLEEKSIEHLLQLIDCHLPSSVLGSRYMFLKNFPVPDHRQIRYTCPVCCSLLPQDEQEFIDCDCGENINLNDLKEGDSNFFVQLSITEQLKRVLSDNKLRALMRKECDERDVIMGHVYKQLREEGVIGDNDITLQWNTDGLKPYKSAKCTAWPVQACINELSYHDRKENMILCGFYYGRKKPDINSFLTPFVEELELMHSEGIDCNIPGHGEPVNVKVHTLLASVDSVARPTLQGIHQYNGEYGCSYCLHPGEQIERGRGRARIYPGEMSELRTREQHLNALEELDEYNRENRPEKMHIEGVKEATVLLRLSNFCIISSFVPDYLHSVLEGCVLTFIKHWIDCNYSEESWYLIKRKRTILSERLTAILPPVEITRPPRGLADLDLLKASELRSFLLYYSLACLKGLLPDKYLRHWFLFVFGISTFLKSKFSQEEFETASNALFKFVQEISIVYPNCPHLYTFNVHLMLHIPRAVDNYGALWGSSTFPYEHFNGVLARLLTGTRCVPQQITRSFLRLRRVSDLGGRVFSKADCSEDGKHLFQKMICKFRTNKYSQLFGDDVRLFGSPDNYVLTLIEKVLVRELLGFEGDQIIAESYRRCIFKGTVFHASFYAALKVRDNSLVALNNGRIMSIKRILIIKERLADDRYCVVLGEEFDILREEICRDRDLNVSSSELFKVCHRSGRMTCALPRNIEVKCVAVPYEDQICVARLINPVERD